MASSAETANADMDVETPLRIMLLTARPSLGFLLLKMLLTARPSLGFLLRTMRLTARPSLGFLLLKNPCLTPYDQELLTREPLGDTATLLKECLTHYRASLNAPSLDDAVVSTGSKILELRAKAMMPIAVKAAPHTRNAAARVLQKAESFRPPPRLELAVLEQASTSSGPSLAPHPDLGTGIVSPGTPGFDLRDQFSPKLAAAVATLAVSFQMTWETIYLMEIAGFTEGIPSTWSSIALWRLFGLLPMKLSQVAYAG